MGRFLTLLLLPVVLLQCATPTAPPEGNWHSPRYRNHPLVGTIWRMEDGRAIDASALLQALSTADFAILGEKHDNPDHHALQAYVLKKLAEDQVLGGVSFEMLDSAQEASLQSVVTQGLLLSDEELQSRLQWDRDGWDWAFYGPLIQFSLQAQVPVRSANASRDEVMNIYGADLDPKIEGRLDEGQRQRLEQEIDESHCGMLPESQFAAMLRVQQLRDAMMAESLAQGSSEAGPRVLIAGNFHARRDLGVPNYLAPEQGRLLSLAFMEVRPGALAAQEYLDSFSDTLPYDYLWFTPAVEAEDYCAGLRGESVSQ